MAGAQFYDENGAEVFPTPTCWCADCGHMFADHPEGGTCVIVGCRPHQFAPRPAHPKPRPFPTPTPTPRGN